MSVYNAADRGIGVNSAIFTLANAVLFHPLPCIAAPARLTWVASVWKDRGRPAESRWD